MYVQFSSESRYHYLSHDGPFNERGITSVMMDLSMRGAERGDNNPTPYDPPPPPGLFVKHTPCNYSGPLNKPVTTNILS